MRKGSQEKASLHSVYRETLGNHMGRESIDPNRINPYKGREPNKAVHPLGKTNGTLQVLTKDFRGLGLPPMNPKQRKRLL
jgi:hypothetical protein